MSKSPFFIKQDLISPLRCEEIVDKLDFRYPNVNEDNIPQKTFKGDEIAELIIYAKFQELIQEIEKYYNVKFRGTEPMVFEWYPPFCLGESAHCENSVYTEKNKWVKQKDRDFSCILFLSDYQDEVPFDNEFEVYGGKLEFPQHHFGFNPQRGTLIIFPSVPYFINQTAPIKEGELFQVRFHVATETPYEYNYKNFPGDYRTWFKDIK